MTSSQPISASYIIEVGEGVAIGGDIFPVLAAEKLIGPAADPIVVANFSAASSALPTARYATVRCLSTPLTRNATWGINWASCICMFFRTLLMYSGSAPEDS